MQASKGTLNKLDQSQHSHSTVTAQLDQSRLFVLAGMGSSQTAAPTRNIDRRKAHHKTHRARHRSHQTVVPTTSFDRLEKVWSHVSKEDASRRKKTLPPGTCPATSASFRAISHAPFDATTTAPYNMLYRVGLLIGSLTGACNPTVCPVHACLQVPLPGSSRSG